MHRNVKMAAKETDFAKLASRRNIKKSVEPMYMKSKRITMFGDTTHLNKKETPLRSAWRVNHDERTDDKLFLERRDLIGQWFNTWNDTQRKRFLDFILDRSAHSQLKFILGWFKKPVRTQLDFVTVLPRAVSSHIFSYLDPRSLCRAACVSWHWKWLVEQDAIWKRKCLKFGWYLPYEPSDLENGAWKKHYVMCIQTMNIGLSTKSPPNDYGNSSSELDGEKKTEKAFKKWKKVLPLIHKEEPLRPPWVSNNFRPKDLELADKALFCKVEERKPLVRNVVAKRSETLRPGNKHARSKTIPSQLTPHLNKKDQGYLRRSKSEDLTFSNGENNPASMMLSEAIKSEMLHQTDGMELGDSREGIDFQQSFKPQRLDSSRMYTINQSMRSLQEFSLAYPNVANPRVLFISSQIPAYELLVNALSYGVLPIVYHHEGTTLGGLLEHFTEVLQGRKAKSVGFFVNGESGSLDLVRGNSVCLSTLDQVEMQKFWQALCMDVLSDDEGHVDIFYPLGGTDPGIELLAQLQILTGLTFSSPTGTVSSIFKVDDDWLAVLRDGNPSKIYFNETKLMTWARAAEYIEDTMIEIRSDMYGRFDDELYGLATKVVGQILFKAFGLLEISEIQDVSKVLVKALVLMTQRKHTEQINPTTCLIHCLQECQKCPSPPKKRVKRSTKRAPLEEKESTDVTKSDGESEVDENNWGSEYQSMCNCDVLRPNCLGVEAEEIYDRLFQRNSNLTERLSLGERRSVIAHEILSSEREYHDTLTIVQNVFRKPLEASIKSNRPVIGAANIRMIFNDSEMLLTLSKDLTNDLSRRLQEWDSHQCLGDVFLKFNTKLKAYMNFLNNYPITLATIEKCQKQHPAFRGFLLQLKQQPRTKLMSLQTLLLKPTERIREYVRLLEALVRHTPVEHKDHKALTNAIEQLKQLKSLFDEAGTRLRRERNLKEIQKRIENCPALVERGRFFIKQEDVVHLRQADVSDVKPEFRIFQNVGNIGLFLFNDCVVVTTKNLTSVPFQRTLEVSYKYHSSLPLSTVKIEDITDSKYVNNAFIIVTPKRQWICQATSKEAKVNWLLILDSSKRTTLNGS